MISDQINCIAIHRAAVDHFSPDDDDVKEKATLLESLVVTLLKAGENGMLSDELADELVELSRTLLKYYPEEGLERARALSHLGSSLHHQFKVNMRFEAPFQGEIQEKDRDILDEAIISLRDAYSSPQLSDKRTRAEYSKALGALYVTAFEYGAGYGPLIKAVENQEWAMQILPKGPSRTEARHEYANSLFYMSMSRADLVKDNVGPARAIAFQIYAEELLSSESAERASHKDLKGAMSWARNAAISEDVTVIDAYRAALRLVDRHVAAVPLSQRLEIVMNDVSGLALDAFSQCFAHGALETAVELLEQGRTILWSHLSRFQTPLDDLSGLNASGKSLAEKFRKLSAVLRQTQEPLEFYKLKREWEDVIKRIREFPGFSRFLLSPLYGGLEKAAQCGPVIIVNGSRSSCEALIIVHQRYPCPIPLEFSPADLSRLSQQFREITESPAPAEQKRNEIIFILRTLWTAVVKPIVDALLYRYFLRRTSRIWLCPTGGFMRLPLHAAGLYSKKGAKLTDYYVPSYTPTLAALIRSRQGVIMSQHDHIRERFLAIGQQRPYEGKELLSVPDELDVLKNLFKPPNLVKPKTDFTVLEDDAATTGNVLEAFKCHGWVHLACHGRPNPNKPFESSFAMRDGPLTLTEIIKLNLPSPEFAFLSACDTSVPDGWTPDEMIHLAARMQFSGFRGVIGTMWAVEDSVVKYMVASFYAELLKDGRKLDASRAAEALHKAIKKVTKDKTVPLEQRIVFIHIGI